MVPGLSIGFYRCGKTNSSKVVEFQTTSLGQKNGSTWSPVFSGSGSYASVFSACTTTARIVCPSCVFQTTNQASRRASSNPIIIIAAIGAFLTSTFANTTGWFQSGRRSASSRSHGAKNHSHKNNTDNVSGDIKKDMADDAETGSPMLADGPATEAKDGDSEDLIQSPPVDILPDFEARDDTSFSELHRFTHHTG